MRINRLLIRESGPLRNIDIYFKPVTLIIGDNDRGKTSIVNWLGHGLFEKPHPLPSGETWSDSLGAESLVQMQVSRFDNIYDPQRLENLLFVREGELAPKQHNPQETVKFWDNEIRALIYGQDDISGKLQNSFLKAMGVGRSGKKAWLNTFHDRLLRFKDALEDVLPETQELYHKENQINQLNALLGSADEQENYMRSQEEVYYLMDKLDLGKKYLDLTAQKKDLEQQKDDVVSDKSIGDLMIQKSARLEKTEDALKILKREINRLENKEQHFEREQLDRYGYSLVRNLINLMIGIILIGAGLYLAFKSIHHIGMTPMKISALVVFVSGLFFVLKTFYFEVMNAWGIDFGMAESRLRKFEKLLGKKQREYERLEQKYFEQRDEYRDIMAEVRRSKGKQLFETRGDQRMEIIRTLENVRDTVFKVFGFDHPRDVLAEVNNIRDYLNDNHIDFDYMDLYRVRREKNDIVHQKSRQAKDYEKMKHNIFGALKPILDELKDSGYPDAVKRFYPEVYEWNVRELQDILDLREKIDSIVDQVAKDRHYAEILVDLFSDLSKKTETLLEKTLENPFFEYIVQYTFGGKYKTFTAALEDKHIRIFAVDGHGNKFPLETLGAGTGVQFWMILKWALAKELLGSEEGIIVMDDPFSYFDALRSKNLIDVLKAFVQEGWQVVCTMQDNKLLYDYFESSFGPYLEATNLNHDYY